MPFEISCNVENDKMLEQYTIKTPKIGLGIDGLVVEKKSAWTFLGKYFYSGNYTYDLSQVKTMLCKALDQQPLNSTLKICRKIFNKEVKAYENSLWRRISRIFARAFGFQASILQPIPKPIQPEPMQQVSPKRPVTPTVSEMPSPEKMIKEAQLASLNGEIGKAASILEDYRKVLKKESLQESDICQGFDIQDDSIGEVWKGICTIGHYNDNILCADEDPETMLHQNVNLLQDILKAHSRGLLFYRKRDQTLHAFRLSADGHIEMFNRDTKVWGICSSEILQNLQLQRTDWCISLGSPLSLLQDVGYHYRTETRDGSRSKDGHFYHEAQGPNSGSFCGVHAANAFLGYRGTNIVSFYQFAREKMKKNEDFELGLEALYQKGQNIADVRQGADSGILMAYLKDFVKTGTLPKEYENIGLRLIKKPHSIMENGLKKTIIEWNQDEIEKISNSKDCDRIIVGYGGFHFAALRKDADNGKWYLIDSMHKESQDIAYDTLEDAIKKPDLANLQDTITLIC